MLGTGYDSDHALTLEAKPGSGGAVLSTTIPVEQVRGAVLRLFSAIRWAPDHRAFRYLRDVIDIFEQHGWDWSYHAFREWQGWSIEHGPDRQDSKPAETITDRQQLLLDWFVRN